MADDGMRGRVDEHVPAESWDMRGYTASGYCGQLVEPLEQERLVLMNTPGFVPFWESDWESDPALERYWFRCPLAPGHEGQHGSYVGSRRWSSRDFWCPSGLEGFDTSAREWYLMWGPDEAGHRLLGPRGNCEARKPSSDEVNGEWWCSLWRHHPGECKYHFVETLDFDWDESPEPDVETAAQWEREWTQEVLDDFLSGRASEWDLIDRHYLAVDEIREFVGTRTTAEERAEARVRRRGKVQAQQDAMQKLWAPKTAGQLALPPGLASVASNPSGPTRRAGPDWGVTNGDAAPEPDASGPWMPPDVAVMIHQRWQGWTLDVIGKNFSLSRERVRQLLKKHGGPTAEDVREQRAARELDEQRERQDAVVAAVRGALGERGPMSVAEVAKLTGLDPADVSKAWPPDLSYLRLRTSGNYENQWSDAAIVEAIRDAALYEFPLTTNAYTELLTQGQVKGPSMPRIWQRFGSWTAACEAAGVVPGQTMRQHYESRWSDDDLLRIARQYLLDPDAPNSAGRFDEWKRAAVPDGPSFQTLRNRFGSWTEVKRRAFTQGGPIT